ncbi:hypothetical protein [Kordia sp.]|uniref:hypothetical protein n=1 Tax=Kordia sp. TaxID=1965332 RepID=UPI003D2A102F
MKYIEAILTTFCGGFLGILCVYLGYNNPYSAMISAGLGSCTGILISSLISKHKNKILNTLTIAYFSIVIILSISYFLSNIKYLNEISFLFLDYIFGEKSHNYVKLYIFSFIGSSLVFLVDGVMKYYFEDETHRKTIIANLKENWFSYIPGSLLFSIIFSFILYFFILNRIISTIPNNWFDNEIDKTHVSGLIIMSAYISWMGVSLFKETYNHYSIK